MKGHNGGPVGGGALMPFELPLPPNLRGQGWKVKIRDRERLEEPHATILFKAPCWRRSLRTGAFPDPGASWRQIPTQLRAHIRDHSATLRVAWNALYPENPVDETDEADEA